MAFSGARFFSLEEDCQLLVLAKFAALDDKNLQNLLLTKKFKLITEDHCFLYEIMRERFRGLEPPVSEDAPKQLLRGYITGAFVARERLQVRCSAMDMSAYILSADIACHNYTNA